MLLAVNFHYIRHHFDAPFASIFGCTPQGFKQALEALALEGTFVSCEEIVAAIENKSSLPEQAIVITFDDGLKEQIDLALPILDQMGIPAIFFVNTQSVVEPVVQNVHKIHLVRSQLSPQKVTEALHEMYEALFVKYDQDEIRLKAIDHYKYDQEDAAILKYKMNFILSSDQVEQVINKLFLVHFGSEESVHQNLYMTKPQLISLANRGYLGSHGHTHVPTGLMQDEKKIQEVVLSQSILTNLTASPIKAFSFPYGSMESAANMEPLLTQAGYKFAFTMERAVNHHLKSPFAFSRIDNNDAPGGKHFKGQSGQFLSTLKSRSWHL